MSTMGQTGGILMAGAAPRCGKTVASAGLAGAMRQVGMRVQAIKPLAFMPEVSVRHGQEQAYFERIAPPLQHVPQLVSPSPFAVGRQERLRFLEAVRQQVYPYFLEAPCPYVASPVWIDNGDVTDVAGLARLLKLPVLLVAPMTADLTGCVAPALAYLEAQGVETVGWITVEAVSMPDAERAVADLDFQSLYLARRYRVPYLGEIAYSPSISVEAMQQGNLVRVTETGLDLLPVQQALNVSVI